VLAGANMFTADLEIDYGVVQGTSQSIPGNVTFSPTTGASAALHVTSGEFAGAITGAGALVKTGAGSTVTLSGDNDYT